MNDKELSVKECYEIIKGKKCEGILGNSNVKLSSFTIKNTNQEINKSFKSTTETRA